MLCSALLTPYMMLQESIRLGTQEWEELVPTSVRSQIKLRGLLGYKEPGANGHSASNGNGPGSSHGVGLGGYRSKLGAVVQ